jgi:hypothetical protein
MNDEMRKKGKDGLGLAFKTFLWVEIACFPDHCRIVSDLSSCVHCRLGMQE